MATDRNNPNQMGSINNDLQQILEPSGSVELPPNQGDIQGQQSARRKTIYTRTELLSQSLPILEGHREGYKKDLLDVGSSRSSSPAEERKIQLMEPFERPTVPEKPVKKIKVLLPARNIRYSCENLRLEGFGNEDGSGDNGKSTNLKKANSEEFLNSKMSEQELEMELELETLSISEISAGSAP